MYIYIYTYFNDGVSSHVLTTGRSFQKCLVPTLFMVTTHITHLAPLVPLVQSLGGPDPTPWSLWLHSRVIIQPDKDEKTPQSSRDHQMITRLPSDSKR